MKNAARVLKRGTRKSSTIKITSRILSRIFIGLLRRQVELNR